MTADEMWAEFVKDNPTGGNEYDAWSFGVSADELAALVLAGKKTATSSAYDLYMIEGEELPKAGEYSVILNSRGDAVCIIQTADVKTVPFCQVDSEFAYKEGEGDRSLEYWREVHRRFFSECLSAVGMTFDENIYVVLKEFKVVYEKKRV